MNEVRARLPASSINVITQSEIESWKLEVQRVMDGWVIEANEKGADGKVLLETAHTLIKKCWVHVRGESHSAVTTLRSAYVTPSGLCDKRP